MTEVTLCAFAGLQMAACEKSACRTGHSGGPEMAAHLKPSSDTTRWCLCFAATEQPLAHEAEKQAVQISDLPDQCHRGRNGP